MEFGRDGRPVEPDGRLDAAAFHRNHEPIWAVLEKFLAGKSGDVLEAGSGTGQHVVHFARLTPDITWWPSDFNEAHLKSIGAWLKHAGLPNIRPPLRIDLSDPAWCPRCMTAAGLKFAGGVLRQCDPYRAVARRRGTVRRSARYLRADGRLFLYGPFKRDGKHTALSNAVFDTSLRERDPEWGVRDIGDVEGLAGSAVWPDRDRANAGQQPDSGIRAIKRVTCAHSARPFASVDRLAARSS